MQPKKQLPKKRKAIRVNLTIDADVWARCKAFSDQSAGAVSWSQIAQEAFTGALDAVDRIRETLAQIDPSMPEHLIKATMLDHYHRSVTELTNELYTEVDAGKFKGTKEPPKTET